MEWLLFVPPQNEEGLRNCPHDDHNRMLECGCDRKTLIGLFPEILFQNTYEIGDLQYVGTVGLTVDSRERSDEGAQPGGLRVFWVWIND